MSEREIILIDEEKCDGCGECVTACAEGALAIVDGKAKLVNDIYCDGLGACIGECPTGALVIEKRTADAFDEEAVKALTASQNKTPAAPLPCGCPGTMARAFKPEKEPQACATGAVPSHLTHWPIQLHLINPAMPKFQQAHVLIAADCTAFAYGDFHNKLLKGKSLIIACPKLDSSEGYMEKLISLFKDATPQSVTVARMEVPCCGGLAQMVTEAHKAAGSQVPLKEILIGVEGDILS